MPTQQQHVNSSPSMVVTRAAMQSYIPRDYTLPAVLESEHRFRADVREELALPNEPWVARAFEYARRNCAGLEAGSGAVEQYVLVKELADVVRGERECCPSCGAMVAEGELHTGAAR